MLESLSLTLTDFHFLRPWCLLGLLPAALLLILYRLRKHSAGSWQRVINPELLPFLMRHKTTSKPRSQLWSSLVWGLVAVITCIGLAGPTWQQLPQPVYKEDSALVLILDLSPSMLAKDIKPSRLVRARYKLIDILKQRKEGVIGLVVYSGDAHTVSPLTDDANTIISMVPALTPTLLPSYGSNTEAAIDTALQLAINGGYTRGDLLLITDEVNSSAFNTIRSSIRKAGNFRLSILGVGTQKGAPIPQQNGGFVKDSKGRIPIPKLNQAELQKLAINNGGRYRQLSNSNDDIDGLLAISQELFPSTTKDLDRTFDLWDDQGFWLAVLLLPFLIFSFRKGTVVLILIVPALFPKPVAAFEWQDLWQTPDQRGATALKNGDWQSAAMLFENNQWKGSAAYQAEDYEQATTNFLASDTADSHYNRGNSLAKSGNLDDAIKAYQQVLAKSPEFEDAIFNKKLVEQLKQQQEQQQEQNQNNSQQNNQQDNQQNNQQSSEDSQDSQSEDSQDEGSQSENDSDQQPSDESQEEQDKESDSGDDESTPDGSQMSEAEKRAEDEQAQQELEQWLRRVPDDPGGLLRAKFRHQAQMRARQRPQSRPPNHQEERW